MTAPRIVLLVLIAIAVLYGLGMARGLGANPGRLGELDYWREKLEEYVPKSPLDPAEARAACRDGKFFNLAPSTTCVATLAVSEKKLRSATLTLVEGTRVDVEYQPYDDDGVAVRTTLERDKPCKLQVFKKGGELTLRWLDSATATRVCKVALEK